MNTKSIYFTTEHYKFREEVQKFLHQEISPFLEEWEAQRVIPGEFWEKMGAAGFLGLYYPKEFGGAQKDIFYSVIFLEELGKTGYTGFRMAVALHAYMATSYLSFIGSEELKQQYLTFAISGKKIAALGISEAQAGSDLSNIQTTAILEKDHFIINGCKKYVINGTTADFIVLVVKTARTNIQSKRGESGLSLIVVDADLQGIAV